MVGLPVPDVVDVVSTGVLLSFTMFDEVASPLKPGARTESRPYKGCTAVAPLLFIERDVNGEAKAVRRYVIGVY